MSGIDWPGLLVVGLEGLGLRPHEFWQLTPMELRLMVGADGQTAALTRARLDELSRAFPDMTRTEEHG